MKTIGDYCLRTKNHKWADASAGTYKYIDLSSVCRDSLMIASSASISADNAPSRAKKIIAHGDVIFATTRPTLRRVAKVSSDYDFQICSTGFTVMRPESEKLDTSYLFYYIQTEFFMERMEKLQRGASYPAVTDTDVKGSKIPIPPLSEQEEIVEVLDTAFAAIDQAKANIEQNIANAKELFQSKLNQIFYQKGEGWVEKALISVTSFIDYRGRTPKKTETGIRLLTAKNVRMGYLKRDPEEFIADADFADWMTRGIPRKGDVLFTTEAPLANVTLLDTDEKIALAQRIITICPDRNILTGEYLSYCLQSKISQDRILEKGTGATVTGIKSKLLKEIPISIAPIGRQESIIQQLDALSESTNQLESHYQSKLASLDELKKSILQKAFLGQLTGDHG